MTEGSDRIVDEVRGFVEARPAPDLRAAVMRQIGDLEPIHAGSGGLRLRRLAAALWAPRTLVVRPIVALGAAVLVAALIVPTMMRAPAVLPATMALDAPDEHLFVQFRLEASASRVQLAGSFTNWEPRYELRESVPGVWTITVPLTEGVHDYAFVVDGHRWVADPYAPQIGDGFGGTNSRLTLLTPGPPQL